MKEIRIMAVGLIVSALIFSLLGCGSGEKDVQPAEKYKEEPVQEQTEYKVEPVQEQTEGTSDELESEDEEEPFVTLEGSGVEIIEDEPLPEENSFLRKLNPGDYQCKEEVVNSELGSETMQICDVVFTYSEKMTIRDIVECFEKSELPWQCGDKDFFENYSKGIYQTQYAISDPYYDPEGGALGRDAAPGEIYFEIEKPYDDPSIKFGDFLVTDVHIRTKEILSNSYLGGGLRLDANEVTYETADEHFSKYNKLEDANYLGQGLSAEDGICYWFFPNKFCTVVSYIRETSGKRRNMEFHYDEEGNFDGWELESISSQLNPL